MRNEEPDSDQLDPTLATLAGSLRQTALDASVPDRDRLMFLCGQAAATNPTIGPSVRMLGSRLWFGVGISVLAFCVGGITVHLLSDVVVESSETPAIVEQTGSEKTDGIRPYSPLMVERSAAFDPQRKQTIRSHQSLYAAIDPTQIESLVASGTVVAGTRADTPLLRVGVGNSFLTGQQTD